MSFTTRFLLIQIDDQTTQLVSAALRNSARIEFEVAADELSKHIADSDANWNAVIVCAGSETLSDEGLLSARKQLGFCPIVVVTDNSETDSCAFSPDLLTLAASDFSPRALQLLLRASSELKDANAKLASLEATAKIKTDVLARQNEFVHNLTSRWCHEVRSPLTAARQFTSMISRQQVDAGDVPGTADRVLRALDDLSMLVDDMSMLSQWEVRCRGVRRKVTRLSDITSEVEHLLRDRARLEGIAFDARFDSTLPDVFADADAVGQAVRNLVVNSLQHSGEGQRVQLWAEPDGEGHVLIGVEDQFDSVDEAEMEEAFGEFCDAEISLASGLHGRRRGLAVARRLLEWNLSELRLESLGERGSVFVFKLPSADPTRLSKHYLQVLRARRPRASLSLLTFVAENDGQFPPGSAIDDFLQTSTTADDLVWQTGPLAWTALLCGNRHEINGRLRLMDALWASRRERDQWLGLPAVSWQQHGSWMRESKDSEITTAFLNLCGVEEARSNARRVLVVDNHPERILRLTHQFEVAGYDVFVARDGTEGISSAAANHPDAIVLDASTSQSSEIAALQQVKRRESSHTAPLIMLASNMRQQQQALDDDAKTVLDQSLHPHQVVEAVQRSLADKSYALAH